MNGARRQRPVTRFCWVQTPKTRKVALLPRLVRQSSGGVAPYRSALGPVGNPLLASPRVRAPEHAIPAPPFPRELTWVNVAPLRMDKQRGRPVLVEFWDFCRPNSLRTLPYLRAWHERYAERRPARDRRPHRRLPARARRRSRSSPPSRGSGSSTPSSSTSGSRSGTSTATRAGPRATSGTPRARCTRCTTARAPTRRPSARSRRCSAWSASSSPPVRPGDEEGALLPAQTADQPGAYSGPYAAGAVWAVRRGRGRAASRTASAFARRRRPARSASSSTRTTPRRRSRSRPARA